MIDLSWKMDEMNYTFDTEGPYIIQDTATLAYVW